ncbi:galactose-1-phosphate uridylyltransferase [Altererythrobacter lutimaris]|uniref:Galactose-1-phosphate uridylyltransferase n=1 Tax=Altererythrobacter lutimaris TaxID=2743979 RepID=A0A850H7R1_9SPHN|nr:galactose-1-phosphate uridylyltransferase [Altererythrobacter lutimaris]NVE93285.1 galactose-1-phosphate uridylyltransferase [Altererythrobacter lutimaris]
MSDQHRLRRAVGEAPVWRRDYRKADGRKLYLYGHEEHNLAPMPESADEIAQGGEVRFHPLRSEWNVYAAHRQNRTFKPPAADDPLAPTRADGPATEIPFEDFELAIFDNKFAAFHNSASETAQLAGMASEPAKGACEVVVYSPKASGSLHTIGKDRRRLLLSAILDRYDALFSSGCNYVLPFENRGDEVGVTLHHPHGQIYGFKHIPHVQQQAMSAFADGYDLAAEINIATPDYGLGESGGIAAFVPRFARFPYEVWLAPMERRAGPWDCTDGELEALAEWLGEITRRFDAMFEGPAATMMAFHAAPNPEAHAAPGYHFTVQFYPLLRAPGRVKYLASVEQHTGTFTVDVMPESAVEALRNV